MARTLAIVARRFLAAMLAMAVFLVGCPPSNGPLAPRAGLPEYQTLATFAVPGPALLSAAGGNLLIPRTDLSIDTQIATLEVAAVWNSATRRWHWNFDDIRYLDGTFTDATGLAASVGALPNGSPIAGTYWVKADHWTIETKGGLRYEFGSDGRLRTMRWASAPTPRLEFHVAPGPDGQPHTLSISQCLVGVAICETVYTFEYDAAGRPSQVGDRAGRAAKYTWDVNGRLVTARDGHDLERGLPGARYEYSAAGDLVAIVNSEGERVEYGFSSKRVVEIRQIGPGTPTRRLYYEGRNENGQYATRYVDATGSETRFRYDASYQLHQIETVSTGDVVQRTWQGFRPTSLTMPNGATTVWTWAQDDVATRVDPSGNVTTFQYDRNAVDRRQALRTPLLRVQDSIGLVETRSYDLQGRLATVANGAGETTSFAYGADQMISRQTLPNGVVVDLDDYGPHGRPGRVRVDGRDYPFEYDAVGNFRSGEAPIVRVEEGGVVAREYDADRNVTTVLVADFWSSLAPTSDEPEVVEIVHRSDGRPLAICRPLGADHEFQYDAFGREVLRRERVDGSWRNTVSGYDPEGRPTHVELPNGMRQELTYDSAGRPYTLRFLRDGQQEGALGMIYEDGMLRYLFDSTRGWETYQYDQAGRVASVRFVEGEELFLGYDLRSQVATELYQMPEDQPLRLLQRSYDLAGRPVALHDQGVLVHQRQFSGGALAHETFGNGLTRTYRYAPTTGAATGSTTLDALGALVENTSLEREPFGSFTWLGVETTTASGVSATTQEGYYLGPVSNTDLNPPTWFQGKRLTAVDVDGGGPVPIASYDALSNLVEDMTSTVAYDARRTRLVSASLLNQPHQQPATVSYTYDAAGFATSRNGRSLTWTATGRLASHGGDISLSWDLIGRLVSYTDNGVTTRFRFGGRVEADAAGNPRAIELGNIRIGLSGAPRLYRHDDFRQNVKFVTNDDGDTLTHYRYGPYGVSEALGSAADPIRFVGARQIGELVIVGARILDPVVGRFLSPDPILNLLNQYAYTLGNPIWFHDVTGLQSASNAQAIGYAIGVQAGALSLGAVAAAGAPPAALAFAAGAFLLGVISGALLLFGGGSATGPSNSPQGSGGGGNGGDGGAAVGTTSSAPAVGMTPVCAPTELARVPNVGWLLLVLGPIQVFLGLAIVVRRGRVAREAAGGGR